MKLGYDYLAVLVAAVEVDLGGEEAVDASCSVAVVAVQEVDRNLCTYPCYEGSDDPPVDKSFYNCIEKSLIKQNLITSFT
jgi:hypothetical protein